MRDPQWPEMGRWWEDKPEDKPKHSNECKACGGLGYVLSLNGREVPCREGDLLAAYDPRAMRAAEEIARLLCVDEFDYVMEQRVTFDCARVAAIITKHFQGE